MYFRRSPPRRGAWDDLDALVLEEVEAAARASPMPRAAAAPFGSDDEFLARASAYFAGHDDPERLLERLCSLPGLLPPDEEAPRSDAEVEPAAIAPEAPEPAPDSDQGPGT
jgi:hypothetical protein